MQRHHLLGLAVAAAGLLTLGTPALAQGERGPAARLLTNRQELALTTEQATRLESMQRRQTELQAELRKSYEETMAVLTPEQREKVREMRQERRGEWRKAGRDRRHGRMHRREEADSSAP